MNVNFKVDRNYKVDFGKNYDWIFLQIIFVNQICIVIKMESTAYVMRFSRNFP